MYVRDTGTTSKPTAWRPVLLGTVRCDWDPADVRLKAAEEHLRTAVARC